MGNVAARSIIIRERIQGKNRNHHCSGGVAVLSKDNGKYFLEMRGKMLACITRAIFGK